MNHLPIDYGYEPKRGDWVYWLVMGIVARHEVARINKIQAMTDAEVLAAIEKEKQRANRT